MARKVTKRKRRKGKSGGRSSANSGSVLSKDSRKKISALTQTFKSAADKFKAVRVQGATKYFSVLTSWFPVAKKAQKRVRKKGKKSRREKSKDLLQKSTQRKLPIKQGFVARSLDLISVVKKQARRFSYTQLSKYLDCNLLYVAVGVNLFVSVNLYLLISSSSLPIVLPLINCRVTSDCMILGVDSYLFVLLNTVAAVFAIVLGYYTFLKDQTLGKIVLLSNIVSGIIFFVAVYKTIVVF